MRFRHGSLGFSTIGGIEASRGLRHESVNHATGRCDSDTGRLEFRDASAESEPSRWSQTRVSGPTDGSVRFSHGSVGIQR